MAAIHFDHIPEELRQRPQWVTWKLQQGTKVPYDAKTGRAASSTDPATWASFEEACAALRRRHHTGIGFVFSSEDPYTGIDVDDCIEPDGQLQPWAQAIVDTMQTYTEISPSETGVKLWVIGSVPKSVKTKQTEVYSEGRYFTVTGQLLPGTPPAIRAVNGELTRLCEALRPAPEPQAAPPRPMPQAGLTADYVRRWCLAALEGERAKMLAAGDGERHDRRLASARALGGLVHTGGLTEQEIFDALDVNHGANVATAQKTIRDGLRYGMDEPREIPPPEARGTSGEASTDGRLFHFPGSAGVIHLDGDMVLIPRKEYEDLRAAAVERDNLKQQVDWEQRILHCESLKPTEKGVLVGLYPIIDAHRDLAANGDRVPLNYDHAATVIKTSKSTVGRAVEAAERIGLWRRDPELAELSDGREVSHMRLDLQPAFDDPRQATVVARAPHGGARPGAGRKPKCPDCPPGTMHRQVTQRTTSYYCQVHGLILEERLPDLVEDYVPEHDRIQDETKERQMISLVSSCSPTVPGNQDETAEDAGGTLDQGPRNQDETGAAPTDNRHSEIIGHLTPPPLPPHQQPIQVSRRGTYAKAVPQ